MTQKEWLAYYGEHHHKFKWFIEKHFIEGLWDELNFLYGLAHQHPVFLTRFYSYLSDIWYGLPDNQFNIIENPEGWTELLHLLENPPRP